MEQPQDIEETIPEAIAQECKGELDDFEFIDTLM
jgi:hypothetical protein